ncbi:hypothetical protein [Mycobacterium colombiense]|uniref:hypothetical protein n=1 Tax=Mycobacterium colombiense TaxID=339268 RepID=UPI00200A8A57|nr:hypothetical protein [Mycobacterium colombiense]MCK8642267.1 hypothetical protein [Mycobacterium colombiense]
MTMLHGTPATVLTAVVVAFIAASMLRSLKNVIRHERLRQEYRQTVLAMRWWMIPAAIGQITIVIAVYIALVHIFPLLGWGWWRMLGNSGNVGLAQTGQSGLIWKVVGVAVPIVVAAVVPWLAHAEELAFRHRAEQQGIRRKVTRQVAFGLTHFWAGIPIAACLALTISGLYFLMVYLRAIAALGPQLEAARQMPQYERLPYPALPANLKSKDPDAWAELQRERERVRTENERRRNEWADTLGEQISASRDCVDQVRRRAVAKSAAAHAVSNWVLIALLVLFLARRALVS